MGTLDTKIIEFGYLKYGDITKIAKAFGISRTSVYNAMNGTTKQPNKELLKEINRIIRIRKREKLKALEALKTAIAESTH